MDPGSENIEEPGPSLTPTTLGDELAQIRHDKGLSGEALGEMLGMSQAKISKIERGAVRVNPNDVEAIGRALGVADGRLSSLLELARRLQSAPAVRRANSKRGVSQDEFATREAAASVLRVLDPVVIPGLLQHSEYTRRILNGYAELETGDPTPMRSWIARQISLRARRQEALYDTSKSFEFVIMESVFLNRFASPSYMLAQIDRVEAAATLPNVVLRIVPTTAQLDFPPVTGFSILDDTVMTETVDEARFVRNEKDLRLYTRLFDHYAARGTTEIGQILKYYKTLYTDLARPKE